LLRAERHKGLRGSCVELQVGGNQLPELLGRAQGSAQLVVVYAAHLSRYSSVNHIPNTNVNADNTETTLAISNTLYLTKQHSKRAHTHELQRIVHILSQTKTYCYRTYPNRAVYWVVVHEATRLQRDRQRQLGCHRPLLQLFRYVIRNGGTLIRKSAELEINKSKAT
jgi:hypothetical protein